MLKNIIRAFAISTLVIGPAHAQVRDITPGLYAPGHFVSTNYVVNPSCFANAKAADFTVSGSGSIARTTTAPLEGVASCALSSTASGDKIKFKTRTIDNSLKNGNCEIGAYYTGDGSKWKAYAEVGSNRVSGEVTLINAGSDGKIISAIYPCGDLSASTQFVFESTAASAATIKVGGAYVGRPISLGANQAIITDWQAYTPNTQGFGTVSALNTKWRRVGSVVEIQGDFTSGTTTAVEARIGLPPNLLIDSNLGTIVYAGAGHVPLSGATGWVNHFQLYGSSGNGYLTIQVPTNSANASTATGTAIASSGVKLTFLAKVPIAGWSGQTVINPATQALQPAGEILSFAGAICPAGWLPADGSAVSRSTYGQLFTRLGSAYGSGDGSTTFNLPDLRGVFLRGNTVVTSIAASGSAASNNVTVTTHGINRSGFPVRVTGTLVTGLSANTTYYAIVVDSNTLAFATTHANALAGTKITISGSAASMSVAQWIDPDTRLAMAPGGNTTGAGSFQYGQNESHTHNYDGSANSYFMLRTTGGAVGLTSGTALANSQTAVQASGGSEARPTNTAVTYCVRAYDQATTAPILTSSVIARDNQVGATTINTVNTLSSNYTATTNDETLIFTASATLVLPPAGNVRGKKYEIISSGTASNITVDPDASETVCGQTTVRVVGNRDALKIQSDGSSWIGLDNTCDRETSIYVTYTSGTPTATRQYPSNWVSSLTDTAVGKYSINTVTGLFSDLPICSCSTLNNNPTQFCSPDPSSWTSSVVPITVGTGAGTDIASNVICKGPR